MKKGRDEQCTLFIDEFFGNNQRIFLSIITDKFIDEFFGC